VNTIALGSDTKPGHWKCPIRNGDEVGDCSFTDLQAKDIEEKLGDIIEKAFTLDKSRKDDWNEVTKKMTWILTTLRQREDFTDEQIVIIGLRLDEWTVNWISLVGREGTTNKTRFMTSGHIVYYLKYWRNFYRYSNQGWEQFISQYRYIYCHRTQKGGSSGTHGESGSKMKPIGLWFLRRLYWLTKGVDAKLYRVDAQ
jgi:hypothetical protein